ncbi:PQQ-binding-like beta-propeller repeat protein [Haloarcula onubensis]|nr:PQQ-binding-like beta-propeller repeat protein [Halomicroarcula sp. S3CR25-11]
MVMDGYVYIAGDGGGVYKLGSGAAEKWAVESSANVTAPLAGMVTRGTVYAATADEQVRSLGIEDGEKRWTFETAGGVQSRPAVDDGTVCAGTETGTVHALIEK